MNENLKELMLEAGFAAPEVAGRAIKLAELIIDKCANLAACNGHVSGFSLHDLIKEHFEIEE